MEEIVIENDIKVVYKTASSFPDGVMDAHKSLHEVVPFSPGRKFFGLSRPERGTIVYKAAAEVLSAAELNAFNDDGIELKKGRYISIMINDFMKDIPAIKKAFEQLLSYPGLDPDGYCVEWYVSNQDVRCMIRLND